MKDELQRLEDWISSERLKYTITNFETDEKKLEEIERQQILLEVQMQILRFKQECNDEQIESWSKQPLPDYMHISTDQRKLLDEVFEFRAKPKQ